MLDGRGVLLDFTPGGSLRDPAAAWAGRFRYAVAPPAADVAALLIRPDGIVAWTGEDEPFEPAARRWFGPDKS